MEKTSGYNCKKCGLCCRSLNRSDLYIHLHDGDGICRHLNEQTNLCSIYHERPLLCNIDESYTHYFSSTMTKEEFYCLNKEGCEFLCATKKMK